MTSERIAKIREEHRSCESRGRGCPCCLECAQPWPCDVAVLLEALDAALKRTLCECGEWYPCKEAGSAWHKPAGEGTE